MKGLRLGLSLTGVASVPLPAFATDYTSAWAPTNLTRSLAFASGPAGSTTADKFTENTATTAEHSAFLTLASTAGARSVIAYFKDISRGFAFLQIATDSAAKRYAVNVNLTTGAVTDTNSVGSPVGISYSVTNGGGGFWRVQVNATHAAGALYGVLGSSNSATPSWNATAAPIYTGDGTSAFLVAR